MVAYGRAAEGVYETQIAWLPWLPVAVGITILALVVSLSLIHIQMCIRDRGMCVQCMHIGSYDDEPATVDLMHDYMKANGYELDNIRCFLPA